MRIGFDTKQMAEDEKARILREKKKHNISRETIEMMEVAGFRVPSYLVGSYFRIKKIKLCK